MNEPFHIPEELIKLKAHQNWEKRQLDGEEGTSQGDWDKAKEYLEKHRWEVHQWKFVRNITFWWEGTFLERTLENFEFLLQKLAFFTILGILGQLAFIVAVVSFVFGEDVRRNNEVFAAWTTITTAHGQSGSGGRKRAIEFLNSRPFRFPWIGLTIDFFGEGRECKRKFVFGRRWKRETLAGLSVPGAYLAEINLCDADLGEANLQDAYLWAANLQDADLEEANLQDADLGKANLQDADLGKANLQDADLGQANLQDADLGQANLQDAYLRGANLQDAYLRGANLQDADLGQANLQDAYLEEANLQDAYLWAANLQDADLGKANLQDADLGKANLQDAVSSGANLQDADLGEANLQDAFLVEANLQDADLRVADLQDADLRVANLQDAYLWAANLQDADLRVANLQGAVFVKIKNLTPKQIKSACFWDMAIYQGEFNKEKGAWIAIEPNNNNFIKELKKDTVSNPEEFPDCSRWEKSN